MVVDDLDDTPNCYRFGVFIDHELVATVRIHHITKAEPYGPIMRTFDDVLRPRLQRGESFINPTMLASEPHYRSPLRALPYLTLRLGLVASVHFDATSCIGVVRDEHTAFYRRVFGAVQVGQPRAYPPFNVPVVFYDADCATNRRASSGAFRSSNRRRWSSACCLPSRPRESFRRSPSCRPRNTTATPPRVRRPSQALPLPSHSNDGVARRDAAGIMAATTANRRDGRSMHMVATAFAGDMDTFPKYLLRNAERLGDRPAMRHKDFGIWQSWTWRAAARRGPQVRARASGAGSRQRRPHRRHRRQPPASLLDICGSAIARRRSGAGLCRRGRRRDGLCARPCRRAFRSGAGPGAGRQDKVVRRRKFPL